MTPFFPPGFDHHIAPSHTFFNIQANTPSPSNSIAQYVGPIAADVANDRKDEIFSHQIRRQITVENETHGWGYF